MQIKVANLSALQEQYATAMELFETVAQNCVEDNLMKYNAKAHLLNAGICCMAMGDQVLITQKVDTFKDIDFSFEDSREGKFFAVVIK